MADEGEPVDETTSYGLRPPAAAPPGGVPTQRDEQLPVRLLGGRYRLIARLGHGGMGTVWRAYDEVVEREVAVKEPRLPEQVAERERENLTQRMRRKARAAARIDHPSVVTVHDVVLEQGRPWLVMELVRGESLAEVLDSGTLEGREAARIGLAVLDALAAAHEAGVLHRDVKPANVLLGRNDRVVLTDFGIARVEGEQGLTETGSFVGSPEYIAPERVLGRRPGPESDLWSLGVLLYCAVEGVSPFRRNTTPATLQAVLSADPPVPARGKGPLATLIMQLLRKEPSARPDAGEARQVLRGIVSPPQPHPGSAPTRAFAGYGGNGHGGAGDRSGLPGRLLPAGRRARAGLGGGLAAVVVLAVLAVLLNPFGGDGGLPAHWEVRDENSVVALSIGMPQGYDRTVPEVDETVENPVRIIDYDSPDRLYRITVWHWAGEERDPLVAAGDQFVSDRGNSDYGENDGGYSAREFRGHPAAEMEFLFVWRGAEEGTPRTLRRSLFVGNKDTGEMWRMQVRMPGEPGAARDLGEELFDEVVEHLRIPGLDRSGDPPGEE
ncbi:serine/threonine-protein kinase [Streptomyces aidingensis]|uniref:non-specific serine/threonine protein kinase n=1 Tax=Streptomyces aidingensis TaxID=910347 RepID=A0A1I1EAJ0_9ACTN|nr:serine/threonine-protein kinase [Streptomyces aidingensis]SFB84111.1 Serine/threonine protein kinase [Streptomyces aidingensis]